MKKICVIGNPIIHSLSPQIYNYLFEKYGLDAYYSRLHLSDISNLAPILQLLKLDAANFTMPYKHSAYQISNSCDEPSLETTACNTILFGEKIKGYNTDFKGFEHIADRLALTEDSKVLLIGAGNTAITVLKVLSKFKCKVDIINRNISNIYKLQNFYNNINKVNNLNISKNYDLIINTSPNLDFIAEIINQIEATSIVDFNYTNPTLYKAVKAYENYIGGLELLILQALHSFSIFSENIFGRKDVFAGTTAKEIIASMENKAARKKNIALVGFTGVGKSFISKILSQSLNMKYYSIDDIIEAKAGKSIKEIFYLYGESRFREYESEVIQEIQGANNLIIDTGAGICQNIDNIKLLKNIAFNIFIISDIENVWNRVDKASKPVVANMNFNDFNSLYFHRLNNYFKCSDMIFYNNYRIEDSASQLKEQLVSYLC